MTGTGLVLLAVALTLATYCSSVTLALLGFSRSALEEHLATRGGAARAAWLFTKQERAFYAISLARTACRLGVFAVVLVEAVGRGDDATLTTPALLIAGVVSMLLLWIFTTVLASAVARHATESLLTGALPVLRVLTILCAPLTSAVAFVDEAVRRLTGANLRAPDDAMEAELLRNIDDTHREGGLDERSAALLENVVEFSSTDVGEVMTPRTDIDGIEVSNDLAAVRVFIVKAGHSRIPVYEENLDHIIGVLYVKDLVPYLGEDGSDFELRPLLRPPIVVPETKPVRELLADFQRSEVHMAMVIDEYGGTAGLVTIEDVLEEIVGEIHDEHESENEEDPACTPGGEGIADVDGRYRVDDLNEQLPLGLPEDEEFDTVAGYVLAMLGRVPEEGETFESEVAKFTVLAATATHVQRVRVALLQPARANGGEKARRG